MMKKGSPLTIYLKIVHKSAGFFTKLKIKCHNIARNLFQNFQFLVSTSTFQFKFL